VKEFGLSIVGMTGLVAIIGLSPINEVLATICGMVTVATFIVAFLIKCKKLRQERIQLAKNALRFCVECRKGTPPKVCPLGIVDRPADCPVKHD